MAELPAALPRSAGRASPRGAAGWAVLADWIGQLLLLLFLVTPVTHNALKVLPLGVLLVLAVRRAIADGGFALLPAVQWFGFFYVTLGLVFVTRGLFLNAPGWPYLLAVYVASPIGMLLLASLVDSAERLHLVVRAVTLGGALSALYLLYYFAWVLGWVPDSLFFVLDAEQNIGLHDGYVQIKSYAISGLVFVIPFCLAYLVTGAIEGSGRHQRRMLFTLVVGLFAVLVSGRRALWVVIMLCPLMTGATLVDALGRRSGAVLKLAQRAALGLLLVAGVGLSIPKVRETLDFDTISQMLVSSFDFQNDGGANERAKQFEALTTEWTERPALGWGWGNGSRDIVRNPDRPWEYELQYALLLYSTGIIGTLLYCSGIVWVALSLWRLRLQWREERPLCTACLVGMLSILVANATNPYLVSPGNMWMVFLPIAVINVGGLRRSRLRRPVSGIPRSTPA